MVGQPSWAGRSCPPTRRTSRSHRTFPTPCHARSTDQRAELHDRLVERPRALSSPGNDLLGGAPKPGAEPLARRAGVKRSSQHPGDIGVHCRGRAFEGEAGHCPGGVAAHTWQPPQLDGVGRDKAGTLAYYFLSQPMQVGRAPIISQPFPALPHHCRRRRRERLDRGILLQKALIICLNPRHLSLLQHELGYDHVVGIAGPAPGQVAAVPAKPAEEAAAELGRAVEYAGAGHG